MKSFFLGRTYSDVNQRILKRGVNLFYCLMVFVASNFIVGAGHLYAAVLNDNIISAINIRSNLNVISGTTETATMEVGEPDFENGEIAGRSVWFKHRASADGFLVLLGVDNSNSSANGFGIGIDVFNGRSFRPSERIVSGFAEDVDEQTITRVLVPVEENQLIYIRIATVGGTAARDFELHIRRTSEDGDLLFVPLRYSYRSVLSPVISGSAFGGVSENFRPLYAYINTTARPGSITYTSFNMPTASIARGGDIVPPRTATKPGFQLVALTWHWRDPNFGQSGTWNYSFISKVRIGSSTKRFAVKIPLIRWRDDRATVNVTAQNSRIEAVLGNTVRAEISVINTSNFPAIGCRVATINSGGPTNLPYELRWRRSVPLGGMNAAFDLPARATRKIELLINTNSVGTANSQSFQVACNDAPAQPFQGPRFTIVSAP